MLAQIREIFSAVPDEEAFFRRIACFYPESDYRYRTIRRAYKLAEDEFVKIRRDTGERYFEHLRCSTLILIYWLYVDDWQMIVAELLHDLVEDIPSWTIERVRQEFGEMISRLVDWMTKRQIDGKDDFRRLPNAPRVFWLMKLPDRLHNLMTLWGCSAEKARLKIEETRNFFLPYARKHQILAHEIEEALEEVEKKLAEGWENVEVNHS